ncbi:cell wall-binding repeat-containing protein [Bacillus sp. PS06]|uniref:cell wall-binding repeat-containing protein n=1 Tax=Bacillus sp. PS06 TaxID=2764176 RepID=UPI0017860BA8|nr:cell wall-binding repeat-containing protein [Bacillus sp. PS06]MBD8070559.1 S8 family serine peptidase [Bacillus sp. PS06]
MNLKRSLALILVFLLAFSNTALAAVKPIHETQNTKQTIQKAGQQLKLDVEKEKYKPADKVRVIVEVKGDPAITYATKKGVKYSKLSENEKDKLQTDILKSQKAVKDKISAESLKMEFKENFTTAFNGFSGVVEYGKVAGIKKLTGVANVTVVNEYERPVDKPDMKYSKELVEAQKAWTDFGYDGEGMIVGIIDTGIDPRHKDMILSDNSKGELTEKEVASLTSEYNLPGKYHTYKVPYGYNYMDKNQEILDLGPEASHHGMHVAGTVAANGDEEKGGLKGVAPEAQLLALKVFGNDPNMASTWGDIYIKAIDDAIILGADVLNMSLGSTASFVDAEDPEQQAIARAVENGVFMSISAGNSAHFGNGHANPYSSNPDIGVVGSPGLSYDSLQVASLENNFMDLDAMSYSFDGNEIALAPFLSASSVHPNDVDSKTFEVLSAGLGGTAEDFAGKDFKGKYALIQRGQYDFTLKALNAQAAGAAGVIIYNNTDGYVNMVSEEAIKIPQLFMLKTDGDALKAAIDNGQVVSITFNGETTTAANPLAGQMSDFTSWGVTPNLDFKPEITAPGGNILSTLQDNKYGSMSGTSMAAPHVSGGSAIVLQRVEEETNLEGKERINLAKNILMNTSAPVVDKGLYNDYYGIDNAYSPRRQGAGLMQLHAALSTPAVVTEKSTNEAKVALKEITGDTATFTLNVKNLSNKQVTYNVDGNVQTDLAYDGVNALESQGVYKNGTISNNAPWIGEYPISFSTKQVTVPANSSKDIKVTIDLKNAIDWFYNAPLEEIFENGYFVEGFVTLTDVSDNNPTLTVPYVGFKGDWNDAPVLDEMIYDGEESFYAVAGFVDGEGYYLGYDPINESYSKSLIAISPNGDGQQDEIVPVLSFLRNAKEVQYNILDEEKNKLRTIKSDQNTRKHYYDGARGPMYTYNTANSWDGKVKNKLVADGTYYYEFASTIDYPGKEAQKIQVPVIIDTVDPELTASLSKDTVKINASDKDGSGVAYIDILVNGKTVLETPLAGNTKEYKLKSQPEAGTIVTVVAVDYAGNDVNAIVNGDNDKTHPVINIITPDVFSVSNTSEVAVSGTVTDDTKIVEITVNGKKVDFTFNKAENYYEFATKLIFEDGDQEFFVGAKDDAGNEISISRLVQVDTTLPTLDVEVPTYVTNSTKSVKLKATLADNADELRFFVDGSEEFYNAPSDQMKKYSKVVETDLTLDPGKNTFELKLVDLAGNTTTKEVVVHRATSDKDEQVSRIAGDNLYKTSAIISAEGWESSDVVILARGDKFVDALAGVPLATKYDAPLLLTRSERLDNVTKAEIERLGAKKVIILGGHLAVKDEVETAIKALGVKVERIAGNNQYDTAALIAKEVAPKGTEEAIIVSGEKFQDALSIASYAGKNGLPILLVNTKEVPSATKTSLKDLGVKETLVIGGELVVPEKVAKTLPSVTRIAGQTKFDTNVEVLKYSKPDTYKLYVATSDRFQDGLSGAALAAKQDAGILLVGESLRPVSENYLVNADPSLVKVFGGELAINASVYAKIKGILE